MPTARRCRQRSGEHTSLALCIETRFIGQLCRSYCSYWDGRLGLGGSLPLLLRFAEVLATLALILVTVPSQCHPTELVGRGCRAIQDTEQLQCSKRLRHTAKTLD